MTQSSESIFKSYILFFQHSTLTCRKRSDTRRPSLHQGVSIQSLAASRDCHKAHGALTPQGAAGCGGKSYDALFKKEKKEKRKGGGGGENLNVTERTRSRAVGFICLAQPVCRSKSSAAELEWTRRRARATRQASQSVKESL